MSGLFATYDASEARPAGKPQAGRPFSYDVFYNVLALRYAKLCHWQVRLFHNDLILVMPQPEIDRRYDILEARKRQVLVEAWKVTPWADRMEGRGKHAMRVNPDLDKRRAAHWVQTEGQRISSERIEAMLERRRVRWNAPVCNRTQRPQKIDGQQRLQELADEGWRPGHHGDDRLSWGDSMLLNWCYLGLATMPDPSNQQPMSPSEIAKKNRQAEPQQSEQSKLEDALAETVPFGMYKGQALSVVVQDERGLSYLHWLRNEASISSQRFKRALERVYDAYESEIEDAARSER